MNVANSKKVLIFLKNQLLLSNKAFLMTIIIFVAMSFASKYFLTPANMLNVLRQICVNTITALGFTFVLGSGYIDLSVGSQVGFTGVIIAMAMKFWGLPIWLSILIGIFVGIACGATNATFTTIFKLPSFVVTLAMQSILRGLIYVITKLQPITMMPSSFLFIGQGYLFSIPFQVYLMLFMIIFSLVLEKRTRFGRHIIAVGGNKIAAAACGINIKKVCFMVYMLMGVIAALSGAILTARTDSGQISAGVGMELDAIAACVIGGTVLGGGRINIIGTVFGAIIIGLTSNSLNLLGVPSQYQIISKGILILLAMVLDVITTSKYSKSSGMDTL